ncbi:7ad49751-1e8e-440e-bcbc-b0e4d67499f2 [Sclerotinia trifoliorum]|uniref:Ubiquitin thioesterase OTU n=1 Tax=Sclerotinia trifoliorum TaxID=28548 RepID=A0A8H2ZVI3_9HELO|nr:7ad49751-1e8e-440e-bcbc-b0e4d67499f2 [Sclerotinia trifoliorum]
MPGIRMRIRGPEGTSTISLPDNAKISDLLSEITSKTSLKNFDIKYGYPPKPLLLSQSEPSLPLSKLDITLNGEQLTISSREERRLDASPKSVVPSASSKTSSTPPQVRDIQTAEAKSFSFSGMHGDVKATSGSNSAKSAPPVTLSRKRGIAGDVPEVPIPELNATIVLRVMPDDNSCLFRAFGTAVLPGDDLSMPELRSIVASTIQGNPEIYSKVVLEQEPDDYCRWIQTPDAWGGAIEMGILAEQFGMEVVCIDVQSLSIHKFHENVSRHRCILVYSGIHYDMLALSPSYSGPENDIRIFDTSDDTIIAKAVELCSKLREKHYFTDTGGMAIKCKDCGVIVHGETQAASHAQQMGHYNMAEVDT